MIQTARPPFRGLKPQAAGRARLVAPPPDLPAAKHLLILLLFLSLRLVGAGHLGDGLYKAGDSLNL